MKKNKRFLWILTAVASGSSALLAVWALSVPLLARHEASTLVERARERLSPPAAGLTDVDEVDCEAAERDLLRAHEISPSNGQARQLLRLAEGCAALRRGDLVLAEGALRAAARSLPLDPEPARWLGTLALARGELETARDQFRRAIELEPGHLAGTLGLSDALAELGQLEEALALLDGLETPQPLALVEIRRGMIFERLERTDDARATYRRAIELAPAMAEPRNNLAALERDAGDLALAWQLQSEAMERSPDDPVLLLNGGLLAIQRGYDDEALRLLRRAAELDEDTADPDRALADHLLVLGRPTEALAALGPALASFPRDAALRNSLGNAYAADGSVDEARSAYQAAVDLGPELAEPHNGLATLLLAEGDLTGAERELELAARLDPANPQVRRNLAELHRRRGERERAEHEGRVAQALGR
jgi:Flp pilus assembly protein TadD